MFSSVSGRFHDKNSFWPHKCPNPGGHPGPLSVLCSRTPHLAFWATPSSPWSPSYPDSTWSLLTHGLDRVQAQYTVGTVRKHTVIENPCRNPQVWALILVPIEVHSTQSPVYYFLLSANMYWARGVGLAPHIHRALQWGNSSCSHRTTLGGQMLTTYPHTINNWNNCHRGAVGGYKERVHWVGESSLLGLQTSVSSPGQRGQDPLELFHKGSSSYAQGLHSRDLITSTKAKVSILPPSPLAVRISTWIWGRYRQPD